jgi:hypothetical protein
LFPRICLYEGKKSFLREEEILDLFVGLYLELNVEDSGNLLDTDDDTFSFSW